MRKYGLKESVVIYYNSKIIHILTGGLAVVILPYTFTTPFLPLVMALLFGVFTYISKA